MKALQTQFDTGGLGIAVATPTCSSCCCCCCCVATVAVTSGSLAGRVSVHAEETGSPGTGLKMLGAAVAPLLAFIVIVAASAAGNSVAIPWVGIIAGIVLAAAILVLPLSWGGTRMPWGPAFLVLLGMGLGSVLEIVVGFAIVSGLSSMQGALGLDFTSVAVLWIVVAGGVGALTFHGTKRAAARRSEAARERVRAARPSWGELPPAPPAPPWVDDLPPAPPTPPDA